MLQKIELHQLLSLSLDQIKDYKAKAQARKTELEALKVKGGKAWTSELQEELDDAALFLVDVEEAIEEKIKAVNAAKVDSYKVPAGTEKMVHLSLVRGRRYNPNTGKEISEPFVQVFTYSEWQLFKKNFARLGFVIVAALHDPYGDAKGLVSTQK